jgi:hypothetical protein
MNEIEQKFYDAFIDLGEEQSSILCQAPIGIYIADFVLYPNSLIPVVVEIDGHDFHKTKEQRYADYKKERFFMDMGYLVVRFMGSEVFVDSKKCVIDAMELHGTFDNVVFSAYEAGSCVKKDGA